MLVDQKYTTVKGVIKFLMEKLPDVELPSLDSIPESILNRQVPLPEFLSPPSPSAQNNMEFEQLSKLPPNNNLSYRTEKPKTIIGTEFNDLISVSEGDDLVFGLNGDDNILGGNGNDIAFGGAGNDSISGGEGDDVVFGESGNDSAFGDAGNDQFFGSKGYDFFSGGTGTDTADYTYLGEAITLQAQGVVDKGSAGSDLLRDVETIIGAKKEANIIDASDGGSLSSIDVNLNQNLLNVNIVNRPSLSFTVKNFVNVKGTSTGDQIIGNNLNNQLLGEEGDDLVVGLGGDDYIEGGAGDDSLAGGYSPLVSPTISIARTDGNDVIDGGTGDDIIEGGSGNDFLQGGSGSDTVDYSYLGRQAITLRPFGEVDKGSAGTDTLRGIETIVGTKDQANAIDGSIYFYEAESTTDPIPSYRFALDVDLSAERLTVTGLPIKLNFNVKEFVNVTGSFGDDTIVGDSGNNNITAGAGDDFVSGGEGQDNLRGTAEFGLGSNETDVLLGGADQDTFFLGDAYNSYYVGNGSSDKAFLEDFQTGEDLIQLNGTINDYVFQDSNTQNLSLGISSTNIYRKEGFAESVDSIVSPGDLVAVVNGTIDRRSDLIFVSNDVVASNF